MGRQPHRIIVEGMDGSGKTTLVKHLAHQFPQLEVVTRPKDVHFDIWWPSELDRLDTAPVPIYDRFFYSELVYGPIIRGKINANMELVNGVAWFMRSTAMLIYARPHSSSIRTAINEHPQMPGVIRHFEQLLEAYDSLMATEMQWYVDRFYHYDWNSEHSNQVIAAVERYLV